jgi:RNA polymerase sigma-70 factor (ECF subfamily)
MSLSPLSAAAKQPQGGKTSKATPACPPWPEAQARRFLRHVAAGDTMAFEQLYHHYAPRLTVFLRRHLGASELVDDVVNEVMLVVWQQAARFRPTCRVSTWLFGIAWYKAHKARKRPHPTPPPEATTHETGSDQDNPERLLWQGECSHLVAHAVASLPPEQRAVVELTYYHACSAPEIAQRLEEAESTVRSRLRLARQRLAQHLAQQGLGPLDGL